jgi:hypothetical protein
VNVDSENKIVARINFPPIEEPGCVGCSYIFLPLPKLNRLDTVKGDKLATARDSPFFVLSAKGCNIM